MRPLQLLPAGLLCVGAAAVLGLSASATYGIAAEYGASAAYGGWLLVALLPTLLALACLLGVRGVLGASRPPRAVLAAVVIALFAVVGVAAITLGGQAHDRRTTAMAAGCSPSDVELLSSIDVPGRTDPVGEEDGGCTVTFAGVPEAAQATADASDALSRAGWQPRGREDDDVLFEREGEVLRLSSFSDGKVTDVRLTLSQR